MLNPYPPAWVAATRLAQHQEASRRGGMVTVVAAVGVTASAVVFGLYHWWAGGSTIVLAAVFGGLAMQFYRRTGVLWPMIVLHYCVDFAILS
jgi:membrane protease YdiL (CAAX protease family)